MSNFIEVRPNWRGRDWGHTDGSRVRVSVRASGKSRKSPLPNAVLWFGDNVVADMGWQCGDRVTVKYDRQQRLMHIQRMTSNGPGGYGYKLGKPGGNGKVGRGHMCIKFAVPAGLSLPRIDTLTVAPHEKHGAVLAVTLPAHRS